MDLNENNKTCPVQKLLDIISKKWILSILRNLYDENNIRFGELKKNIGTITTKSLTTQLKLLEENNIIKKTVYNESPPRVEYQITQKGREIKSVIISLQNIENKYKS